MRQKGPSSTGRSPDRSALILAGLLVLVAVVYSPCWRGGVLWDDIAHLTSPALRGGDGLRRIWLEIGATQQYYPVVHSAFWLMDRLWGDQLLGYHLVNLVLHAFSAWMFGLVLRRLSVPGAWLAALVFALHPVQVESVAWITELKNTLSGAFGVAFVLVYLRFDERRSVRLYAGAFVLFVLALFSKSVTATLAPAILVILWWRRGTIDWRRDVAPIVPFMVAGLASGLFTAWVERTFIGAEGAEFQLSALEGVLLAGRVFWFYLAKLVWPVDLAFFYPRWTIDRAVWWQYVYPAAAIASPIAAWRWRSRSRAPLAVLLVFAGTLVPVLGFLNIYPFRHSYVANHFLYLPSLAIAAAVGAVVTMTARRWKANQAAILAATLIVPAPLALLSFQEARHYADARTLYNVTLERNPESWLAYSNLALLDLKGTPPDLVSAAANLQSALRLNPESAELQRSLRLLAALHLELGASLHRQGQFEGAIAEYREALRLNPGLAAARDNLAAALGHVKIR